MFGRLGMITRQKSILEYMLVECLEGIGNNNNLIDNQNSSNNQANTLNQENHLSSIFAFAVLNYAQLHYTFRPAHPSDMISERFMKKFSNFFSINDLLKLSLEKLYIQLMDRTSKYKLQIAKKLIPLHYITNGFVSSIHGYENKINEINQIILTNYKEFLKNTEYLESLLESALIVFLIRLQI